MTHAFTWADFYLICFAVGFCFSFLSFLMGGARGGHFHLPHFHGQVGAGHLPSSHAAHQSADISPFNLITLTAFLAWFGGTGYLLTRYSTLWVGLGLLASGVSGVV